MARRRPGAPTGAWTHGRAGGEPGDGGGAGGGSGADLGGGKFMDVKGRQAGLRPAAVGIVATVRAHK